MRDPQRTPAAIIDDIVSMFPPAEQDTVREKLTILARRGGGAGFGINASPALAPLMRELFDAVGREPPILE